jgi:hypothetical protein
VGGSLEPREKRGRVGRLKGPSFLPGVFVLCSPVCTAGADFSLTAWALEAHGTETGGGARSVHTGTPIEAWGWREEAVRVWVPCL